MDKFERRLQVLERNVQRSRRVNRILVVAVLAIASFAGAQRGTQEAAQQQPPQQSPLVDQSRTKVAPSYGNTRLRTIEADQFVLLDRVGRSRVRMVVSDGGPVITMLDEHGKKRLELSQTPLAAGLRLFDAKETPVVSLQLPTTNEPAYLEFRSTQGSSLTRAAGFAVQDAAQQQRVHLGLINGNFPVLGLSQSGQQGPPSIEMTASGVANRLKFHDKTGVPLVSVVSTGEGKSILSMRHPNHERSLQVSSGPKESDGPVVSFFAPANEGGTGGILPHLQLGLNLHGKPYVRVVDSDGRPIFQAPSAP